MLGFASQLLAAYMLTLCSAQQFEFPSSFSTDLQLYSNISVTSTCTSSTLYNCNPSCPNRNDFPTKSTPLKVTPDSCYGFVGSASTAAVTGNGGIVFNSTATTCTEKSFIYNVVSPHYFILTMWVKASCNPTCKIFSIGSSLTVTFDGKLNLGSLQGAASRGLWHFIAIRFNGRPAWFVNGQWADIQSFSGGTSYNLTLGPATILGVSNYIDIVDVRWYSDALTNREVTSLYSGSSLIDVELMSSCRCPATHPALVQNTKPVKYMKCSNGIEEVLRLGKNVYIPEYMLDGDDSTQWISGEVNEANITLNLGSQFQLKSLTLKGVDAPSSSLTIILLRNGMEINVVPVSGSSITHNFEQDSINKRADYENVVADKVIVRKKTTAAGYFRVSELTLEARCSCYGNDKDCVIGNGVYSCSCRSASNTVGQHCDVCKAEYFRPADDFQCPKQCDCDDTGSLNRSCAEVDGQCNCRTNVEGRRCTECKHNTANFSNTGCDDCPCNPNGIASCSDDLDCNCKQNVESSSGKCEACIPDYYNISQSSGCSSCNCDASGTVDTQPNCDNVTGQCYCKANVQERVCNVCKDEYYGLSAAKSDGCDACGCNIVGSESLVCDKASGSCTCVDGRNHADDGNRQCTPMGLHLDPSYGPVAGGTRLTLTGTLLGTNPSVSLQLAGEEQNVKSRNHSMIVFETEQATEGNKKISLSWTYRSLTYHAEEIENMTGFMYKKNPQLIIPSTNIMSFASGGCTLRLQGSNIDSVPYPKMLVHLKNGGEEESLCMEEDGSLKCPTPDLREHNTNTTYQYGFQMDGVDDYENATKHSSMLVVVPDPMVYTGMSETYRNTFDKVLRIKGERLQEACHDSDVTITLGDKNCALLSRTKHSITCDPGEKFPGTARTVQVKVKIGNFERVWGELTINSFWTNTEFIIIAVCVGVFLIIVVVIIVCTVRCRKRSSYSKYNNDTTAGEEFTSLNQLSANHQRPRQNNYERNPVAIIPPLDSTAGERTSKMIADDFCERLKKSVGKVVKTSLIERSNIEIGKKCTHKGKKIRVINGQYSASSSSPYSGSSLTIKTLIESYTEEGELPEWLNNALQECIRLQDFVNDNVLRMQGIAVDAKNLYIIYPEMSNRTLKDYLSPVKRTLTAEQKLDICMQVSDGMNYLSSNGIVHKDLAARNCWVTHDAIVKIGDSSFSYDLYPDEYLENNGRYQPVRWMAPESLRQGFYDTKSDVWSFGVLIWEVYTNGYLPYYDIENNEDVRTKVCDQHYRLGKPHHDCSDAIFQLIEDCHKDSSEERPNFFIIQKSFDNIVNPEVPSSHLYENRAFTSGGSEDDLEDYVNTKFTAGPPRPPKGKRP